MHVLFLFSTAGNPFGSESDDDERGVGQGVREGSGYHVSPLQGLPPPPRGEGSGRGGTARARAHG